ncbi:TetR/AcrR family transcriptional regulator [Prescottella agglutinans]|uniref:TetR/AcrR family transcriptional regulator n=1 Tax=Prescottella agglutinans TaxID=1644129 RepID=A0A438BDR8_9NOCA|nr:TetR/AcrR family transcriptional regulator [Prescottella agglutinans]RVW09118.1 TetR/AcrR family transcriptional regulator [Prescottella agglutinans]
MTIEGTREALVRAGVELLEETGSADVGLRAIARRAGVSHGAPRRWFPTHRSLLAAIAEVGLADLATALTEAAGRPGHELADVAEAYVEFAVRRPAMFTLVFRHDLLEGSGAELRNVSRPLFRWLVAMVEKKTGSGDPEGDAAALWVGVHGIATLASTGSLELAVEGVDRRALIGRVVRNSLSSR